MKIEFRDSIDPRGYTGRELLQICNSYNLDYIKFNEALGVNTVCVNEEGKSLIYRQDVENALHKLLNGNYLFFD